MVTPSILDKMYEAFKKIKILNQARRELEKAEKIVRQLKRKEVKAEREHHEAAEALYREIMNSAPAMPATPATPAAPATPATSSSSATSFASIPASRSADFVSLITKKQKQFKPLTPYQSLQKDLKRIRTFTKEEWKKVCKAHNDKLKRFTGLRQTFTLFYLRPISKKIGYYKNLLTGEELEFQKQRNDDGRITGKENSYYQLENYMDKHHPLQPVCKCKRNKCPIGNQHAPEIKLTHEGVTCVIPADMFKETRDPKIVRQHSVAHRNFYCKLCDEYFPSSNQLNTHRKKHESPFECKFCGARFTRKQSLSRHKIKRCKLNPDLQVSKKRRLGEKITL